MKSVLVVYLLSLGIIMGVEVAAGAFVAPVIFFPKHLLGEGVLSHFQSGVLMTEIFLRMNFLLFIISVLSVIFEASLWITKKNEYKDRYALLFSAIAFAFMMAFVYYYTPFIVDAQSQGDVATTSELFRNMHKQSEWVMKALMMIQVGLFLRRGFLVSKH